MLRGYVMLSCSVVLLALFASAQGRAVNISNTWVLPEEGFPVFYRYFRDRISWYEADAVCQFHHANLVTVDTTAQYDAVRAYLKELDISSAVWVGLIRSNPDGDFTWTDYRGLGGDGYWSSAPDARAAPLCAAADPAADYRWEARACGGPTVTSFICELPVPQWALGPQGCMVRALPALTVLYLPESAAVQLTADCGMAGTKRVQCTGNVKREDLLRNLSCTEDEESSSTPSEISIGTTWSITTDTAYTDQDTTNDFTTEENTTTEHISEVTPTDVKPTPAPIFEVKSPLKEQIIINKLNMYSNKNINLDLLHNNNLQSNDIPKLSYNENFLTVEQSEKLEDEKHMHHKMLHDELAKHGNFETIFTQPTDHFVPPLVMAKAKISDDMTVLSLAEKHAQQLAEQRLAKHTMINEDPEYFRLENEKSTNKVTTEEPVRINILDKSLVMTMQANKSKNNQKKDKIKLGSPKKYMEKYDDPKRKNVKIDNKLFKIDKSTDLSIQTHIMSTTVATTIVPEKTDTNEPEEDSSMDLTVMLKELGMEDSRVPHYFNNSDNVPRVELIQNNTHENKQEPEITTTEKTTTKYNTVSEIQTESVPNIPLNHEVIKITIVKDNEHGLSSTPTIFEITTRLPEITDDGKHVITLPTSDTEHPVGQISTMTSSITTKNKDIAKNHKNNIFTSTLRMNTTRGDFVTTSINIFTTSSPISNLKEESIEDIESTTDEVQTTKPPQSYVTIDVENHEIETTTTTTNIPYTTNKENTVEMPINQTDSIEKVKNSTEKIETVDNSQVNQEAVTTTVEMDYNTTKDKTDNVYNYTNSQEDDYAKNWTDSIEAIDDFQSPLLSAANEPLHRPNRSRRPVHPPSRLNKFNPFRILG